jgi:hypothetical protein
MRYNNICGPGVITSGRIICRGGGTGRRNGLKIRRVVRPVPVRFRSSAPVNKGLEQLVLSWQALLLCIIGDSIGDNSMQTKNNAGHFRACVFARFSILLASDREMPSILAMLYCVLSCSDQRSVRIDQKNVKLSRNNSYKIELLCLVLQGRKYMLPCKERFFYSNVPTVYSIDLNWHPIRLMEESEFGQRWRNSNYPYTITWRD